jgi:DNA polymerase-3 subunit gamma/tau
MPSLSRTYRPQTFADIADQEPVKETLRLEVETGKLGHAYLFAGPRGVGKTTMARVFAKALNCLQPTKGEPCNTCDACNEVNSGSALDVIEMDAASNTGVDNVREAIVEHVRFVPQRKHKVYILDEAHMLSTSAWNALLKTIEEPPAYAVFILVTTELHKVPATIQSRCQRFDFKRIPDEALAVRLMELAKKEGATVESDVIKSIVAKADGGLRDAESLLGQILSLGEKKVTAEIASLVLPISRLPIAAEILSVWSKRELGPALQRVAELEEAGIPLLPLFDDLLQAIRELLRASDSASYRSRLSNGDEGEKKLAGLVGVYAAPELADMALLCMERRRDVKQGADPRFCMELAATAVALRLLPHATGGSGSISPPASTNPQARVNSGATETRPVPQPTQAETSQGKPSQPQASVRTEPVKTEAAPTHAPASTGENARAESVFTLTQAQQKWSAFIKLVDAKSPSLTFILKLTRPYSVDGPRVTLAFQYPFHKEKICGDIKAKRLVEDCMAEALQVSSVQIDGMIASEEPEAKELRSRDMVSNILRAFEGQLVEGGESPAAS